MQRHKDIKLPEHAQQLVVQRKSAYEQRLLVQFLALPPRAQAYPGGQARRRARTCARSSCWPSSTAVRLSPASWAAGWNCRPSARSTSPTSWPAAGLRCLCPVIQAPHDVQRVKQGDRVAVNPSRPCSACVYCLKGLPNHCLDMRFYGSAMRAPHVEGAFRNLLVCDATECEAAAPGVSPQQAALAEPFSVALHGVSRAGPLLGKRVPGSGCGPIGALAVAAARVQRAAEITAVALTDGTLVVARAMGADVTVNVATESDWVQRNATDGRTHKSSFDVMFECGGNERTLGAGLETMRLRGVVVQLGPGGTVSIPQNMGVGKDLSTCGSFRFHAEFALAVSLINAGRVNMAPMASGAVPFSRAKGRLNWPATARRP